MHSHGYAANNAKETLKPFKFERREPAANDVAIEILYCGVCHSDIHQVNQDWGPATYPMVPGHEIVGRVTQVGSSVTKFKVGDFAGVGCMVASCQNCTYCKEGEEQFCAEGATFTYNSLDKVSGGTTYGGYSDAIVVDAAFALKISPDADLAATAPLLCAGITTYSPMRHWNVQPGQRVGIIGLGGLGHMALKFARSFDAHVVQFTTSTSKIEDAKRLGADEVVLSKDEAAMKAEAGKFDFILDTVSAPHDVNGVLDLLKPDGSLVLVGLPPEPFTLSAFPLVMGRRTLAGSMIGGIAETQEMLDYCAAKGIKSDIELIPIQKLAEAFERTQKADVKYRFVIDMASLKQ